jgi:hypothetical protein
MQCRWLPNRQIQLMNYVATIPSVNAETNRDVKHNHHNIFVRNCHGMSTFKCLMNPIFKKIYALKIAYLWS